MFTCTTLASRQRNVSVIVPWQTNEKEICSDLSFAKKSNTILMLMELKYNLPPIAHITIPDILAWKLVVTKTELHFGCY